MAHEGERKQRQITDYTAVAREGERGGFDNKYVQTKKRDRPDGDTVGQLLKEETRTQRSSVETEHDDHNDN